MSDKTELPKEWQQEAENVAEIAGNYLQGAKAMRDAMEKKIKDKRAEFEADYLAATDEVEKEQIVRASIEFKLFLQDLKSLTPTQDGK